MNPPLTYYGGKSNLINELMPLIPPHNVYCEPFFGGGALYFAKTPAKVNVINDKLDMAVNFYEVMKNNYEELNALIQSTLHSETQHRRARNYLKETDPIKRAWAFWVSVNLSFTGKVRGGFAYSIGKANNRTTNTKKMIFNECGAALENAIIFNRDALDVIKLYDTEETLIYADPPYYASDCGHYKGYKKADFINLLDTLQNIKGKFLLSSYPTPELEEYTERNKWNIKTIEKAIGVDGKNPNLAGRRKIEVITYNYQLEDTLF